jgi:type VI secretion system protein ImpF
MEPDDQRPVLKLQPRLYKGQLTPLFERLVENHPPAQEPLRSYEIQDAAESVRREVERVLNTRCATTSGGNLAQTVIQYGVPDFTHISVANTLDLLALSRQLTQAVQSFEPRLANVYVELQPDPKNPNGAIGHIHAKLQIRMVSEAVCFPLALGRHGKASIAEHEETP